MPDEVDDLILKMQHLEAAARESQTARSKEGRFAALKTKAQQMAAGAQLEIEAAGKQQAEGEARQEQARTPGRAPLEAADLLLTGRDLAQQAKTRLVKARARLNFALDQMDLAERNDWEALQAAARAEAHAQLAESGDDSSRIPELKSAPGAAAGASGSLAGPSGGSGHDAPGGSDAPGSGTPGSDAPGNGTPGSTSPDSDEGGGTPGGA
jgi:hypothetical protein